jgi:hypothetical protein
VSSPTYNCLIKMWRVVDTDVLHNIDALPAGRELFQPGAVKLLNDHVPVLIDHDKGRQVGVVRELSNFADTDGLWLTAHATITDPPPWLKRGTGASISYATAGHCSLGPALQRVTRGLMTEVSVLSPGTEPAEPRAKVLVFAERVAPTVPAGEVFHGGGVLVRRNIGRVTGYTDEYGQRWEFEVAS